MPDIAMCNGDGCAKRDTCYRATATPSYYQSYFTLNPIKDENSGECPEYWDDAEYKKDKGGKKKKNGAT